MTKHIQEFESMAAHKVRERIIMRAYEAPTSTFFPKLARTKRPIGW
jgi:hypothetical protein